MSAGLGRVGEDVDRGDGVKLSPHWCGGVLYDFTHFTAFGITG